MFNKTLKIALQRLDFGLKKKAENLVPVKNSTEQKPKEATRAGGNQKIIYYPLKGQSDDLVIFKCKYCSYKSKSETNYQEHLENHKNSVIPIEKNSQQKRLYECKDCSYKTYVRIHMEYHYRRHRNLDEIAKYKCNLCKYKTFDQQQFNNHQIRIHSIDMCFCFNCDYRTSNKKLLIQHMVVHLAIYNPSNNTYDCPKCWYQSIRKHRFQQHFNNVHANEDLFIYKCSECDFRTKTKNNLQNHIACHKKSSTLLKCLFCSFETHDKYNFSKHRKTHKPIRYCEQCDYQTTDYKLLKGHIKNYHDATNLYCYNCSFNTRFKLRLVQHMKIHIRSEKPTYKCKYCSFSTIDRVFFRRHLSNHEGCDESGMHNCELCDFRTKYKSFLIRHQRSHDRKNRPLQCSVCSHSTRSKSKLEKHMLSHKSRDEVVLYKCRMCKYDTKYKGNLIKHIKDKHDEYDSNTS